MYIRLYNPEMYISRQTYAYTGVYTVYILHIYTLIQVHIHLYSIHTAYIYTVIQYTGVYTIHAYTTVSIIYTHACTVYRCAYTLIFCTTIVCIRFCKCIKMLRSNKNVERTVRH